MTFPIRLARLIPLTIVFTLLFVQAIIYILVPQIKPKKDDDITRNKNAAFKSNNEKNGLPDNDCKPSHLGPVTVDASATSEKEVENELSWVLPGGHWAAPNCPHQDSVAILVPFRLRENHLAVWLRHMHPFLRKQNIDYTIFVVEQTANDRFNRAMLLNAGSLEAAKLFPFRCFIHHDVDMLPEDARNVYSCSDQPRHLSVGTSRLNYTLPYESYFGGVVALSSAAFKKVNGYSNSFWGWGGEDDDMANRLRQKGLVIERPPERVGRYFTLQHRRPVPHPYRFQNIKRGKNNTMESDGLNSCLYELLRIERRKLYTWMLIELLKTEGTGK